MQHLNAASARARQASVSNVIDNGRLRPQQLPSRGYRHDTTAFVISDSSKSEQGHENRHEQVKNEQAFVPSNCSSRCQSSMPEPYDQALKLPRLCNSRHGTEGPKKTWNSPEKGYLSDGESTSSLRLSGQRSSHTVLLPSARAGLCVYSGREESLQRRQSYLHTGLTSQGVRLPAPSSLPPHIALPPTPDENVNTVIRQSMKTFSNSTTSLRTIGHSATDSIRPFSGRDGSNQGADQFCVGKPLNPATSVGKALKDLTGEQSQHSIGLNAAAGSSNQSRNTVAALSVQPVIERTTMADTEADLISQTLRKVECPVKHRLSVDVHALAQMPGIAPPITRYRARSNTDSPQTNARCEVRERLSPPHPFQFHSKDQQWPRRDVRNSAYTTTKPDVGTEKRRHSKLQSRGRYFAEHNGDTEQFSD